MRRVVKYHLNRLDKPNLMKTSKPSVMELGIHHSFPQKICGGITLCVCSGLCLVKRTIPSQCPHYYIPTQEPESHLKATKLKYIHTWKVYKYLFCCVVVHCYKLWPHFTNCFCCKHTKCNNPLL